MQGAMSGTSNGTELAPRPSSVPGGGGGTSTCNGQGGGGLPRTPTRPHLALVNPSLRSIALRALGTDHEGGAKNSRGMLSGSPKDKPDPYGGVDDVPVRDGELL